MGRPDGLCMLCGEAVQQKDEPYQVWKTYYQWSSGKEICEECMLFLHNVYFHVSDPDWHWKQGHGQS